MSDTTAAPAAPAGDPMEAWVRAAQSVTEPAPQAPDREQPQPGQAPQQPGQAPATGPGPSGEPESQPDPSTEGDPAEKPEDEAEAREKRLHIEAREARKAARRAADEAERYRAELAAQRQASGQPETEEARIERRAAELIAERQQREAVASFNQRCNEIYDLGVKELGDEFKDAIEDLQAAKLIPPTLIEAADEAGDAHKVLAYLGKHPEEAKRIAAMSPWRMGAAVAKIAAQAAEAKAPAPRQRSNAPPPVRGVVGAGTARGEPDPENMSMADFVRWQDKHDAERRSW